MTATARSAYTAPGAPVRNPRSTEYDAIARITARMKSAQVNVPAAFAELASAVHDNRRLWTVLATDAAGADNALPEELRARLIYLAEFTDQHSRRVLAGEADASPLVEINTAVMRGLRGQGGEVPA